MKMTGDLTFGSAATKNPNQTSSSSTTKEQCTFDLRNLTAINSHQISNKALYSSAARRQEEEEHSSSKVTIPHANTAVQPIETYLLDKASDGCAQLVRALWQLPSQRSDAGPMVVLPSYDEIRIPRSLVSVASIISISCHVTSNNVMLYLFIATAASQERNQVGEVCSRERLASQQEQALAKGLGRGERDLDVPTWLQQGKR